MPLNSRLKIGFVMSTEVGWRTQYLNWKACLKPEIGVDPIWIPIQWWKDGGLIESLPVVPSGIKARIRSRLEFKEGLTRGPFDALYVTVGHVLHGSGNRLKQQPYFITTDVTPIQLHRFGDLYGIYPSRFKIYEKRKHEGWCERYQNAAAIFACSHWTAKSLIDDYGVSPEKVVVLPPGIETSKWQFPLRVIHDDPVNILFVGGHFVRKGGDTLLEWASLTKHKNWNLHIVTRDNVVTSDPRIHVYHGLNSNEPELMDLYRQADMFVLPTLGDCYSLASMEAMSSGLPVILSNTGGTGDIIEDGKDGYLIPPGDGAALADRIDHLLANPELRISMGLVAREEAVKRFDAATNIESTIQEISRRIGKPQPTTAKVQVSSAMRPSLKRLHIGFIMSTEVGWRTQYLNWKAGLSPDLAVDPEWIEINWWKDKGLIERIPLVPKGVKARLRSHMELREGMKKGPFDALYIGIGHVLHGQQNLLSAQPYFISSDVTTKQLHEFGELYGIMRSRFGFYEKRKFLGWQERYQNAAALFPWSHWAADSMIDDYGASKDVVHVIPAGVDIAKWKFDRNVQRDTKMVNILFVGGEFKRKGGDLLLQWGKATKEKNWTIHMVTKDRVATDDSRVHVYNNLSSNDPDLMQLYNNADMFVLPTLGDCYSIASVEAMASGLPIIVSLTGGIGDIIHDGETGYLVNPGEKEMLFDRIDYLVQNQDVRTRMGSLARIDAENRYDATKNIAKTISIIRTTLGKN